MPRMQRLNTSINGVAVPRARPNWITKTNQFVLLTGRLDALLGSAVAPSSDGCGGRSARWDSAAGGSARSAASARCIAHDVMRLLSTWPAPFAAAPSPKRRTYHTRAALSCMDRLSSPVLCIVSQKLVDGHTRRWAMRHVITGGRRQRCRVPGDLRKPYTMQTEQLASE